MSDILKTHPWRIRVILPEPQAVFTMAGRFPDEASAETCAEAFRPVFAKIGARVELLKNDIGLVF